MSTKIRFGQTDILTGTVISHRNRGAQLIPYLDYEALLTNGSSVMFYYDSGLSISVLLTSGIIRTDLEHPVMALSLHETGKFSIIDFLIEREDLPSDNCVEKRRIESMSTSGEVFTPRQRIPMLVDPAL